MKKSVNHPTFSSRNCTACWKCIEACPKKAIRKVGFLWHRHAIPLYARCIGCNLCVKACPQGCFKAGNG
ncbi:MAG: 4Fe-4S binding protein [Muribaculaceae bacterium]|nr:4Fe-4S binding protein [Muribaculaceae bacterium]